MGNTDLPDELEGQSLVHGSWMTAMAVHEPEGGTALSPALLTALLVAATAKWKTAAMAGVFLPSLRGLHRDLVLARESLHPLTWQIAVEAAIGSCDRFRVFS